MTDRREIVERFLATFYTGKSGTARQFLADDLIFVGPSVTFNSADAFLKTTTHVAGVKAVQVRKVFVGEPDEVCVWYELEIDHSVGSIPIAEWFHLTGERISEMRMILDTGPFAATTSGQQAATAVDPVCHMTVDQTSAAATREHAGTTYYFCSPGCATVFENAPYKLLESAR